MTLRLPLKGARQATARRVIFKVTQRNLTKTAPETYLRHFYEVALELNPLLISGLLGAAQPSFVSLCRGFKTSMDGWVSECFHLPGSEPLDPATYADKIVAAAEAWMSPVKILQDSTIPTHPL